MIKTGIRGRSIPAKQTSNSNPVDIKERAVSTNLSFMAQNEIAS
jgi:hypothetical protein